jgi:hypothetical protein
MAEGAEAGRHQMGDAAKKPKERWSWTKSEGEEEGTIKLPQASRSTIPPACRPVATQRSTPKRLATHVQGAPG